jgi:hypothetical protein
MSVILFLNIWTWKSYKTLPRRFEFQYILLRIMLILTSLNVIFGFLAIFLPRSGESVLLDQNLIYTRYYLTITRNLGRIRVYHERKIFGVKNWKRKSLFKSIWPLNKPTTFHIYTHTHTHTHTHTYLLYAIQLYRIVSHPSTHISIPEAPKGENIWNQFSLSTLWYGRILLEIWDFKSNVSLNTVTIFSFPKSFLLPSLNSKPWYMIFVKPVSRNLH